MSRINYRIDDLRALLALAHHMSFVRGAETLHITQSAFSRRISQLEEVVGARLVERTSRRVALTPLGQSLAEQVRVFLPQLDRSMEDAYQQARGESGSVTLACLTTVAYSCLPAVLGEFRQAFPNVRLHVRDDTGQRVTQSVINREAEFGVTVHDEPAADLVVQPVAEDPFVLAISPDHPLAQKSSISWHELAKWRPVTLGRSSANRALIDARLLREGIDPPWFDEVEHLSTMLGFLRNAEFVGVLPRMALDARDPRSRDAPIDPSCAQTRNCADSPGRDRTEQCRPVLVGHAGEQPAWPSEARQISRSSCRRGSDASFPKVCPLSPLGNPRTALASILDGSEPAEDRLEVRQQGKF